MKLFEIYDIESLTPEAVKLLSEPRSLVDDMRINTEHLKEIIPQVLNWLEFVKADPSIVLLYQQFFEYGRKYLLVRFSDDFVKNNDLDFWKKKVLNQADKIEKEAINNDFRQLVNGMTSRFNKSAEDQVHRMATQAPDKKYL